MVEFQGADDFFTTVAEGGGKAYRFTDIDGIGPATADKITSIRGVQNPEDVAEMSADELSDKAGISHSRATKAIKGGGGNPNVSKTGGSGGTVSAAGFKQRQGDFMVDFAEKEKAHGRNDTRTRSEEAVKVDDRKRAPVTTNYDKWKQNPSKWDFPGVDTPKQKPDLLTKDVKAGDPETTDFEARDEDIRERKEMSYPRKVKDGRVLQLEGNRVPAFQVNQEVPDIPGAAPGLSKDDFEEDEPEPGPDVMGPEPSSQRLPETARQNLASGESADISFVQAEQSRSEQQPPEDIDVETLEFAKEREGELVGRKPTMGQEFQVGRIKEVDESEGRVRFETIQNQPYSGEKKKDRNLRVFSDRGFFDLNEDVREQVGLGTFAIQNDTIYEATTGGMGGGSLENPVGEL